MMTERTSSVIQCWNSLKILERTDIRRCFIKYYIYVPRLQWGRVHVLLFKAIIPDYLNILVGIGMMGGCLIIPTECTIIY